MNGTLEFCNFDDGAGYFNDEPVLFHGDAASRSAPSEIVVQGFIGRLHKAARLAIVVGKLPVLHAIAMELFDKISFIDILDDPEIAGAQYVTIAVRSRGEVRAIADLRKEWYRRIRAILNGQEDLVHLAIDIIE